jgi:hypothetical protein
MICVELLDLCSVKDSSLKIKFIPYRRHTGVHHEHQLSGSCCCEARTKLFGQNREWCYVESGGTHNYHCTLNF